MQLLWSFLLHPSSAPGAMDAVQNVSPLIACHAATKLLVCFNSAQILEVKRHRGAAEWVD